MFNFQIGKVNIDLTLLIAVIAIALIIVVVRITSLNLACKNIFKSCISGQYDKVLLKAPKVLETYQDNAKINPHKNIIAIIESLNLSLAISYLATSNTDLFFEHINAVQSRKNDKHFWLSLHYLLQDDIDKATEYYVLIENCDETQNIIRLLDGIILFKRGDIENSNKELTELMPKLKYAFLKETASQFIK